MWCLISTENGFDVIPTNWIIDKVTMYYPPANIKFAARIQKEPDPQFWETRTILEIKRDNFETFEKAWENCIRLDAGRQTKSASETELKGRGLRLKKRKNWSEPAAAKSSQSRKTCSPVKTCPVKKLATFPTPPKIKANSLKDSEKKSNNTLPRRNLFPEKSGNSLDQSNAKTAADPVNLLAKDVKKCRLNAKQYHYACPFDKDVPCTSEILGHAICKISRSMEKTLSGLKTITSKLSSLDERLKSLEKNMKNITAMEGDRSCVSNKKVEEILANAPFESLEELQTFEEKIEDERTLRTIVQVFAKDDTKSSLAKTARKVVKRILGPSLWKYFNLKGKGEKNKFAFNGLLTYKIMNGVVEKVWKDVPAWQVKMNKTCGEFLVQNASGRKPSIKKNQNGDSNHNLASLEKNHPEAGSRIRDESESERSFHQSDGDTGTEESYDNHCQNVSDDDGNQSQSILSDDANGDEHGQKIVSDCENGNDSGSATQFVSTRKSKIPISEDSDENAK